MKLDIVRAWKDQTYREHLSEEQLARVPANPAGDLELSESNLATVYGGNCPGGGDRYRSDSWGNHGNVAVQHNSNICSIICSYNCSVDILDILDLDLL
jgi:mersacidin/lichenicidin family type 2 lantibiotic